MEKQWTEKSDQFGGRAKGMYQCTNRRCKTKTIPHRDFVCAETADS